MPTKRRQIRYAVMGAGNIAQVAVPPAFEHAKENSRLVAVVSGDPAKCEALREDYDLEYAGGYDEFERILEQGRIDAVYIATPNTRHREFAERAAAAGAHVLCEKPLAPTVADCDAMAAACEEHGAKLMVAYRLHFEAATLSAIQIVRSGEIGEPRLFSSFFSHVVRQGDIRRNPSLAGGALYDLGVYCINAARNLFGTEPTAVYASAVEKDGVDETTTAVMKSTKKKSFKKRDQFAAELVYFSSCIANDREPEPSAEEGIFDVRVIEAALTSMKTGKVVELPPRTRKQRPSLVKRFTAPR